MSDEAQLQALVNAVQTHRKYAQIEPCLIRRLATSALTKGLSGKAAVKDVRGKLHQVGTAYLKSTPDPESALQTLEDLSWELHSNEIMQFCRQQMQTHASTAERLPILPQFFQTCLEPILPVTSILDLACGLNPLALSWMPLQAPYTYTACDIFQDLLAVVDGFFNHCKVDGSTFSCDLAGSAPHNKAQVAFLLKTLPCLEQIDKDLALPLLKSVQSSHILVSFPVRSLGGRKKGMLEFYRDHFLELTDSAGWQIQEFNFATELAFLVTK